MMVELKFPMEFQGTVTGDISKFVFFAFFSLFALSNGPRLLGFIDLKVCFKGYGSNENSGRLILFMTCTGEKA